MNRIAQNLTKEFALDNGLIALPESEQFEHLSSFLALRRHYSRAVDTNHVVTGAGGDTGLDGVAVIVNGKLVTDVDEVQELLELNGFLDVTFVFIQAERNEHFDSGKILKIGAGVLDFFRPDPRIPRNHKLQEIAAIAEAVFARSSNFKYGNPDCHIYYVTTGQKADSPEIAANLAKVKDDLIATGNFGGVEIYTFGANDIQRLATQIKFAVKREFTFKNAVEMPIVPGVTTAFLGYVPAKEFVALIADEAGDSIMSSLFYDNVRDWQDYNEVNDEMRATLKSQSSSMFVLMNNGVTIIARMLGQVGSKFTIEDFRIVNGCQTSNVIFDQRAALADDVMVPLRLIATDQESVVQAIVKGTNRQTELRPEQFYALNDFSKSLEEYFQTHPEKVRLYYERRDGQYDRTPIAKSKTISPQDLIKSFAAMFLSEPHVAAKSYKTLRDDIGTRFFAQNHRLEPYFIAALCAYHLENQFRGKIDPKYKSARYHLLLAARLLMDPNPVAKLNSYAMAKSCNDMNAILSDQDKVDKLMQDAVSIIDQIVGDDLARDTVRTVATTTAILEKLENKKSG
jgi:hypothetical protein